VPVFIFYRFSVFLKWQQQPRMTRTTRMGGHKETTRGAFQSAPVAVKETAAGLVSSARPSGGLLLSLVFFHTRDRKQARPTGSCWPVVLALCVWWRRGRIQWGGCCGACAVFALISAIASVWTIWEQKFHAGAIGAEWTAGPGRSGSSSRGRRRSGFYLGKLIWPHPLIFYLSAVGN